jgi:hypothetical protein
MRRWLVLSAFAAGCSDPVASGTATPATPPTTASAGDDDDSGPVDPPDPTGPTDETPTGDTGPGTTEPVDDSVQQLCVDEINAYRDTLGLPHYARWSTAEPCADGEAQSDSISGVAHGAFGSCGEWAQNECPGWPQPYERVVEDCLAMMWAEGPGADFNQHGHYINMSSTQYSEVACGFYTTPGGAVWAVQDFR